MDITLTLQDLLKLILFLLGIGVLTYLLLILRNVNKTIGQAQSMLEANAKELDTVIKQLPEITTNINKLTSESTKLVSEMSPDISEIGRAHV